MSERSRPLRRELLVLAVFVGAAALYLWPIFHGFGSRIAPDAGDAVLNATVLWWNATVLPFSADWWNQPWFHPATGVTSFTENLVGLGPIATPIYWITGNPVLTYNLTFFATWPLSAFAMYFLVRRVTGRTDAGIVAGFAYAFTPYRAVPEFGHLQSLTGFALPVALAALHTFIVTGRTRWLILFGTAWLMQALMNGYYMLFGSVLIAMWLAYFGSAPARFRASLIALGAWILSSLPLIPIFLGYHRIHEFYGLRRTFEEAVAFSAAAESWLKISGRMLLWHHVLPDGKDPFFPGLTVVLLVIAGALIGVSRSRTGVTSWRTRLLNVSLGMAFLAGLVALTAYVVTGPWIFRVGSAVVFKMSDPYRALVVLVICGALLFWRVPLVAAVKARPAFVFYALAGVAMAVLACGPVVRSGNGVILDHGPYRALMMLPGFDQVRVPSRFWMMGVLCLSVAAGIGYAAVVRGQRSVRYMLCGVVSALIFAEGWLISIPTAAVPSTWTSIDGGHLDLPLLELPLGPQWDHAATFRATAHRRRVMNGVSGFDPPHYPALAAGLRARDPEMLTALASLGAYEVSIEHASDSTGRWQQYVSGISGATRVADDGTRVLFRIPASAQRPPEVGEAQPIASVRASAGDASVLMDGRRDTAWIDGPQQDSQWLLADLGTPRLVGGVSLALREFAPFFPRHLNIDVSVDGEQFVETWQGTTFGSTFLAVVANPTDAWLRVAFPPHQARFVRIRQTAVERIPWAVADLQINAPAAVSRTDSRNR